jgi:hypothetical protein
MVSNFMETRYTLSIKYLYFFSLVLFLRIKDIYPKYNHALAIRNLDKL